MLLTLFLTELIALCSQVKALTEPIQLTLLPLCANAPLKPNNLLAILEFYKTLKFSKENLENHNLKRDVLQLKPLNQLMLMASKQF